MAEGKTYLTEEAMSAETALAELTKLIKEYNVVTVNLNTRDTEEGFKEFKLRLVIDL